MVIYFNAALVSFKVDHQWILNTIDDCHNDDSYEYRMGIDFTFEDTAVIFSVIGAGFGASTATITIENILWSETSFIKRVLRGLIGAAVIVSIFLIVKLIPHEDHPTKFFFNNLLPHLAAAYCAYGLVPIISKYIGLVNRGTDMYGSVIKGNLLKFKGFYNLNLGPDSFRQITEAEAEDDYHKEMEDVVPELDRSDLTIEK